MYLWSKMLLKTLTDTYRKLFNTFKSKLVTKVSRCKAFSQRVIVFGEVKILPVAALSKTVKKTHDVTL